VKLRHGSVLQRGRARAGAELALRALERVRRPKLQRGRARAGAELALLLLLLAQARNTSIATACTDSVVIMFMLSDRLVAICLF
jgi:hypothetical protein